MDDRHAVEASRRQRLVRRHGQQRIAEGGPVEGLHQLEVVQERLTELRWREATLKSLDDCPSEERLRRLEILSRVQRLPQARRTLTDHWYRELPAAMPKRRLDIMIAMLSPDPPQDPDPATVLACAELHLLISTPAFTRWTQDHAEEMRDGPAFYGEIDDAAVLTAAAPSASRGPTSKKARVRVRTDLARSGNDAGVTAAS
ncbi:hypothetical protein ACLB9X_09845 [Streptomyces sp. 5K101]|uniref:hypothetical protein n=1 Tax=Streptomyces sp. 5K101 TaxID=3390037 RepID=UPI00397491A9